MDSGATDLNGNTMGLFDIVNTLICATLIFSLNVDGLNEQQFYQKTLFVNRLITQLSLWSKSNIESDISCGFNCVRDSNCASFFYNQATHVCTGHAVQFYGNETSEEAEETMYYTKNIDKRDCAEIQSHDEKSEDGVYVINPLDGKGPIKVYCDMSTDGGGWTVFQRRKDGTVDFYLDWASYKAGFGSPDEEFWLGNDNIHRLSNARSSVLRIDMVDQADATGYAEYTDFSIDSETDNYRLHINVFTGNRGNGLSGYGNVQFSTKDKDNDISSLSCSQFCKGSWWYKKCHRSNLNGKYGSSTYAAAMSWGPWHGYETSLKSSEMKLRPS